METVRRPVNLEAYTPRGSSSSRRTVPLSVVGPGPRGRQTPGATPTAPTDPSASPDRMSETGTTQESARRRAPSTLTRSDPTAPSDAASVFRPTPFSSGRRNRQYSAERLPTLDESDSDEPEGSFEDVEEEEEDVGEAHDGTDHPDNSSSNNNNSPRTPRSDRAASLEPVRTPPPELHRGTRRHGTSSGSRSPSSSSSQTRSAGSPLVRDRLAQLLLRASDAAARGHDEEALAEYRTGLRLTRTETARIQRQRKQLRNQPLHPTAMSSIHSRLHEDWLEVGQAIVEIRKNMAILCERCGDYAKALQCGKEARQVLDRHLVFLNQQQRRREQYAQRIEQTKARIKDMDALLERMKLSHASFDDRKAMHEQIILMRKQIDWEPDGRKRHDLLATTTLKVQKALQTEQKVLGTDHPQIADTLSLLATLAYESGLMESSREYMNQAIDTARQVLGDKHPTTGEILLQAARIYAPQKELQAHDYYTRATRIFQKAGLYPMVASTLNEMAAQQMRHKKHKDAMESLHQALEALSSLDEANNAEIAAHIHRNLGECHSAQKDYAQSVVAYERAVDKLRLLGQTADAPAGEGLPHTYGEVMEGEELAETLRRLGKSYMYCGKHEEALVVYGEALEIHRSHVINAAHPGRPSRVLPERQDQLAHTLFCLAEARETTDDLDEALKLYSESMQLRLFSDAHRAEKRLNMVHCAMCLRGIGSVHLAKREYEAAKKVFEDALRYCEAHGLSDAHAIKSMIKKQSAQASKLAGEYIDEQKSDKEELNSPTRQGSPAGPFPRERHQKLVDEIAALEKQAARFVGCDDRERAIESLTKLMSARKALLKLLKTHHANATDEKYETACTLLTFGKVLLKNDDAINAERALEDAVKLFRKNRSARDLEGLKEAQQTLKSITRVQL